MLALTSAVSFAAEGLRPVSLDGQPKAPAGVSAGEPVRGTQIGVWANTAYFQKGDTPKFWVFAKSNGRSPITISNNGSLYQDSFVYIYSNFKEVARIPVSGPESDGLTANKYFSGGWALPKLAPGCYTVQWRTSKLESNAFDFEVL